MDKITQPVDRSEWGAGPWDGEPDRAEWEHAGLPCLAVRARGHWCGYAAVPPGHPWHGQDDADVDVHGGITYTSACSGEICHVPKPGEPDDVWWFGFDCAHSGDYSPWLSRFTDSGTYRHAMDLGMNLCGGRVQVYRTLDYVRAEANRLAEQLAAVPR